MKRYPALALLVCLSLTIPALGQDKYVKDLGGTFFFNGDSVMEPADDLSSSRLEPAAFGIPPAKNQKAGSYSLLPGENFETKVYQVDSGLPGATVYIVAGTHGDERAGWYAGMMLASCGINAGKLYVLPRANLPGSLKAQRLLPSGGDLNRAYPGKAEGDQAQRLAAAIFTDIKNAAPDLVLDLHEAADYASDRDFMGNKLIFTDLEGMESLFFDLLSASEEGFLAQHPFGYVSPGTSGSLNRVVSIQLGIPVITIETFRGFPLSKRVQDQVDIVLYCLRHEGML